MSDRNGALGDILRELKRATGVGLADLTVLSSQKDPFRLDTPAFHEAGKWLADQMAACGLIGRSRRPIHNRGIHYAIVARGDVKLPSGKPYINDADCWTFLEDRASKAARWLGYVPFDAITDARNSEPIIRTSEPEQFRATIRFESSINLPGIGDLRPKVEAQYLPRQPYKLVFFGEKTSLDSALDPLATAYGADLYLPSGEISDTLLWRMASTGAADGREMVVLVFADCDPAGYQMAVSIAHKLRALREYLYPSLSFRVLTPALTVEQVTELRLPSTPLKQTELRATGWRDQYGVEQTEIDALATLQPDTLRQIVREVVAPFFDATLDQRTDEAKRVWEDQAQSVFDDEIENDNLSVMYVQAAEHLEILRSKMEAIEFAVSSAKVSLPQFDAPESELGPQPDGLVSSDTPLLDAIRILRDRKRYGADNGGAS